MLFLLRLRIKSHLCFLFWQNFHLSHVAGADGYIHASLDIQTVKIRKRNMTDKQLDYQTGKRRRSKIHAAP